MKTHEERAHWRALGREMRRRFREPLRHPTFVLYFLGITILLGGLGVWWELLCRFAGFQRIGGSPPTDSWSCINAATTYLVALAAASLVDLTLRSELEGFRAFRVVTFLLATLSVLAGSIGLIAKQMPVAVVASLIGVSLSLITWWIVNADNNTLRDDPPPTAPTGGNTEQKLGGSLEGFTS